MTSRPIKRRKDAPEHKYLPKVVMHAMGPPSIAPACSCGWTGPVNFRPSAKITWKEHVHAARDA